MFDVKQQEKECNASACISLIDSAQALVLNLSLNEFLSLSPILPA